MAAKLPSNVHVSTHPCLQAKLSQLRSASTTPKETKSLIHEISIILGIEALAGTTKVKDIGKVRFVLVMLFALLSSE
jgi:uracil phosphoribosyltransferase